MNVFFIQNVCNCLDYILVVFRLCAQLTCNIQAMVIKVARIKSVYDCVTLSSVATVKYAGWIYCYFDKLLRKSTTNFEQCIKCWCVTYHIKYTARFFHSSYVDLRGYFAGTGTVTRATTQVAAEYHQGIPTSGSHSSTTYETYRVYQEESGCVHVLLSCL